MESKVPKDHQIPQEIPKGAIKVDSDGNKIMLMPSMFVPENKDLSRYRIQGVGVGKTAPDGTVVLAKNGKK